MVAVAFFAVSVAVGYQLSRDGFSHQAPWSDAASAGEGGAAESFASYRLSTSVEGEGRVLTSMVGPLYADGQELILTAQPSPGATFVGWSGDLEGTRSPITVEMDDDKTVVATFERDTTPPEVLTKTVTAASAAAVVTWTTDDPSTSQVKVGTGAAYEVGTFERRNLTRDHAVTVTGLTPGTTYHYVVASANGAQYSASAPDATFTTAAGSVPLIDVFGGPTQVVGQNGQPQVAYGLLGSVSDPDGVASLSYTLNGAAPRGLSIGPDGRRVYGPGDFNADIAYADLRPGANEVVITATDGGGSVATSTVVLQYQPVTPSLPYSTNWAKAGRIADQAQVVDGRWGLDGGTVRPLEMGYDRLLMVGDVSWHDYEVTVPITVHGLGPGNGSLRSGNSLVGLALNWNGHSQVQDEQPPRYWYPTGALAWHRWFEPEGRWELRGNEDDPIVRHTRTTLDFDSTYVFKARSETVDGGVEYSWKVWRQGAPEPEQWDLTVVENNGPPTGSVGVIAHHIDIQFGDISVTPIED